MITKSIDPRIGEMIPPWYAVSPGVKNRNTLQMNTSLIKSPVMGFSSPPFYVGVFHPANLTGDLIREVGRE